MVDSKSSDKLKILMEQIESFKKDPFIKDRIKSLKIDWVGIPLQEDDYGHNKMICPNLTIDFFSK